MQPFRASPLGGGAGGGSSYYYSPKSATQQPSLPVTMVVSNQQSGPLGRMNYNQQQQGSATVIQQPPPIFQRQQRANYLDNSPVPGSQIYAASPQMITKTATYSQQRSSPANIQGYPVGPTVYQTAISTQLPPTNTIVQPPQQQIYQQSIPAAPVMPMLSAMPGSPSNAQTYAYALQKQYAPQLLTSSAQYAPSSNQQQVQYIASAGTPTGLVGPSVTSNMPVRTVQGQMVPVLIHQSGEVTPMCQVPTMLQQSQPTNILPSQPSMINPGQIVSAHVYSGQLMPQVEMPPMSSIQSKNLVYTTAPQESLMAGTYSVVPEIRDMGLDVQPYYAAAAAVRPVPNEEPHEVEKRESSDLGADEPPTQNEERSAQEGAGRGAMEPAARYEWDAPPAITPATAASTMLDTIIPQTSGVSRQTPIEVGSVMPSAHIDLHGVCVNLQEFFEERSGVLFGVLGAFNPQDTKVTVPLILSNMPAFERLVDFVGCLSVNDPFVIKAWAKKLGVSDQFTFIADSDARFTEALGVGINLPEKGLGLRCRRFGAVVGPRATFRYVAFDEDARADRILSLLPRFVRTPWKSFLIGICYEDDFSAPKGKSGGAFSTVYQSINDMRNYLADYGFCSESDWQLILSNCLEEVFKPTAENIMSGLKWLVDGTQAGDVLCCYINGQTVKRIDPTTGEESLCIKAIDHLDGGLVSLADVAAVLLPAVPENCRLNLIVDGACMSLDLSYCNGENVRDVPANQSRASKRSHDPVCDPIGEIFVLEARKYGAAQALTRLPKLSTYRAVARELSGTNVPLTNTDSSGQEPVINFWSSRPINLDQELHISDVLDPTEFSAQQNPSASN